MRRALKFIKDILWPVFCVGCGQEGEWWCAECYMNERKALASAPRCPACGRPSDMGAVCARCEAVSYLVKETAFLFYAENNNVGRLIKSWKYGFAEEIGEIWGRVIRHGLSELFANVDNFDWYDYQVIAVPLHPRRLAERGFNQAEVVARHIAEIGGLSLTRGLKRVKYTTQQARLGFWERRENIRGAFAWDNTVSAPKKIILVDDIFTTGATMQEAARTLKAAGTREVWGMTLGRGEM